MSNPPVPGASDAAPRPWTPTLSKATKAAVGEMLADPGLAQAEHSGHPDKFGDPAGDGAPASPPPPAVDAAVRSAAPGEIKPPCWITTPSGQQVWLDADGVWYTMRPWDTPEFRKEVEDRCDVIDASELDTKFRLYQTVAVYPGKLTVVFRSTVPREDSFHSKASPKDISFTGDSVFDRNVFLLALSLERVEGTLVPGGSMTFPDPYVPQDDGTSRVWQEPVFRENLRRLQDELLTAVVNKLIPQLLWFTNRMDKEFTGDGLGKG